ncbi:MAG: HNH endonuclease domain-containing protein [Candidatus Gastranaerophilales bacterium]|nr:HNH endonuclease domain-containing protein [Candidatus Gastranaerophilales bacterium]
MSTKVFAFDMGKVGIGFVVRDGHNILELQSLIVDKDHSEIASNRDRRRIHKTLQAHKEREIFFYNLWKDAGLTPLDKSDKKFTKEFTAKSEEVIYNSTLLRIALLQNKPLEEWQIYKALHSAFQRRGYDADLPWKNSKTKDEEDNKELVEKYTKQGDAELIKNEEYKYPCYYEAIRLGLWDEANSTELKKHIPLQGAIKVRDTKFVAPRSMVVKELTKLWENAQLQLPQLNHISVEYFLYGEYEAAYGSFLIPEFKKFRGTRRDWQGVLGQKIPRFDNRIIMKCKLLPKRNVCSANTIENVSLVLLMKLKNLRFTNILNEKQKLTAEEIKLIYENWLQKVKENKGKLETTIIKKEIEEIIGKKSIKDKIEPLKANTSGRSSFCRRACKIINKIILDGIDNPMEIELSQFMDNPNSPNPITAEEIMTMLSKIGTWDNLYIPDNREEFAQLASDEVEKTDILIGSITNSIVRNRLQILRNILLDLKEKFGTPDEIIFEFIRDGADNSLFGKKKAEAAQSFIRKNEKENEEIKKELKDVNADSKNFLKLKLLKTQDGRCIYSGKSIGISDFDACEVEHIYPRAVGGNDALYNKVLCYREENQAKGVRTPYEWLRHNDAGWHDYVERLNTIKTKLGKKKFELLTSKPEDCAKMIDSYNALAETAQIAKISQQIAAFIFGWGLQTEGSNRHVFTSNGALTAKIRSQYRLNSLLGDDFKKNRANAKHHALDAICISYSRDFKYNAATKKDFIDGFNPQQVKEAIDKLMPYPYSNDKPFKGNIKPLETIYGKKIKDGKTYITQRISIETFEPKDKKIKSILDEVIKEDLLNKLEEKPNQTEWKNLLQNYIHPTKKTLVKKVLTIVSEGQVEIDSNARERIGEFCDYGNKGVKSQFKHSKGHKGQILYYNDKGALKVMPIYANIKTDDVKVVLQDSGYKLYNKGELFYSGCLVEIPKEFKAGAKNYPAGIYKLRTMMSDGQVKLESSTGLEILSSAKNLADVKFKKLKKDK